MAQTSATKCFSVQKHNSQVLYFLTPILTIRYLHNPIIHLYYPSRLLHNHCLQFLLGHENVPREVENNAYADFWGVKEVYYGICASGEFCQVIAKLHLSFHPSHF